MEVFDKKLIGDNQLSVALDNVTVTQELLLKVHKGQRSLEALSECIKV